MTRRRPMTPARRLRIGEAADWICCLCGFEIDPVRQAWTVEHKLALGLEGPDDDDNCGPAHEKCRREKDKIDVAMMAKADRAKARHTGGKTPPRKPMAGSRASPFRKRMDGTVERRR